MNPVLMALIIGSLLAMFVVSARRRWALLMAGTVTSESRFQDVPQRLGRVWRWAVVQTKMRDYFWAGVAHQLIFMGFIVLLLRTLILWGRGFDPEFNLFVLGPEGFLGLPLGSIYTFLKDVFAVLVLAGASVFVYYRTLNKQRRMTLSGEGLLILGIIMSMMLADIFYDGASLALNQRYATACSADGAWCERALTLIAPLGDPGPRLAWHVTEPAGTLAALLLGSAEIGTLVVIAHAGFWLHSSLVLIFLNILPYSKHFHIITAVPNVFLSDTTPPGRLRPVAAGTEALMAKVEQAMEKPESGIAVGRSRIEHFTWKDFLDFYTCTECGRCSDNCPATMTGKLLSPKHLTLDLRDNAYARQDVLRASPPPTSLAALRKAAQPSVTPEGAEVPAGEGAEAPAAAVETPNGKAHAPIELVPDVIKPEVLWACTTCRACEDRCPVSISYVDKIVQMRRNLVVMRGEFPAELNKPFEGMEVNGNPWNLSREDRKGWSEGLDVPLVSEQPDAEVLYWVGCAASYDQRARKIARSTAQLLKAAGVKFAILGDAESCTGDPARRAGNEYLFSMLAEANVATLNEVQEKRKTPILTTCPHCFNTLLNEYPDFGGKYDVVHHTDFIMGLLAQGKLSPTRPVQGKVTYHDSCYLGRYNGVYEAPREILKRIPGLELVEPEYWTKNKGLCCGAGGAQMFMEEQNKDRVNVKRTLQLIGTGATTVASACPFCMTMLTDGLKAQNKEAEIRQLDVVEMLVESCGLNDVRSDGSKQLEATASAGVA
jgi:Fe-S oxidoreductase